jgi:FkbM family methyltransferase
MAAERVGKFESRLAARARIIFLCRLPCPCPHARGNPHALTTGEFEINESELLAEVDKLLDEDPTSVRDREAAAFDDAVGTRGRSLVLFGAGGLGRKTLAGLRQVGIEPLAFADNNPDLWGKSVEGLPVLSLPDAGREYGRTAAFICAIWRAGSTDTMGARTSQLRAAGCTCVTSFGPVFWKYPQVFVPHYSFDLPHKVLEARDEIREACRIWQDEASRREFLAQIRWRLKLDFDGLPRPVKHETYFPDDLLEIRAEEQFVDCGAFDGDTLRAFLRHAGGGQSFASIDSFEPDPANFKKLEESTSRLSPSIRDKVRIHPCAVGSQTEMVRFDAQSNEASSVGAGTLEVRCVDLDHYLAGRAPSYIKMDIEGFEPEALRGASSIIRRHVPVLAICVYHRQDHLWRLPLFMRSLSEEYRLFLRPHDLEVWDLVCYAVPNKRLLRGGR